MYNMFAYSGVGTLTLGSNFTTKNTTDLRNMFFYAPNVKTRNALRNPNAQTWMMFGGAATSSSARIYVDYTSATYSMAYDLVYYSGTGLRLSMGSRVS